jgi:hypothetical protein
MLQSHFVKFFATEQALNTTSAPLNRRENKSLACQALWARVVSLASRSHWGRHVRAVVTKFPHRT